MHTVDHRKFKCIICKKPLLEIIVDKYQEEIIKVSKGAHMNVFVSNEVIIQWIIVRDPINLLKTNKIKMVNNLAIQ